MAVVLANHRTFELRPTAPFRLDLTVWALRRRARNRMDSWNGRYGRAALLDGAPATLEVEQDISDDAPSLKVTVTMVNEPTDTHLAAAEVLIDRLLGVSSDLTGFYEMAQAEPLIAPLIRRFSGVHPPRFPTLFEALANAVANQQLTLEVGIDLLNRLTDAYGVIAPGPNGGIPAFPTAEAVAGSATAPLRDMGFSARKAEYLIGIAEAITSGEIDPGELEAMDRAEATEALMALRGIGRWSAEYILLRGLGRLDVYPADDVGARNKLQHLLGLDHGPARDEILSILEPWSPCAGMVYFHLLLDGLAASGYIEPE